MTSPTTDKDLLALFDARLRAGAEPDEPGTRVERAGAVVRCTGATPDAWHGVLYSELDAATADAEIAAQIAYFGALHGSGAAFEWKVYGHDEPADLGARLAAAGFQAEPTETVFVAEISKMVQISKTVQLSESKAGLPDAPPPGITLRPVTTAADADLVAAAHDAAFGSGGALARDRALARLAADPDTVWTWVATADGEPVSAARMLLHPGTGFASLWGGGTAPRWRGRGIYRSLVAHRMRIAAGLGCEYLQVDATDQSRPILERLGFRAVSTATGYTYDF